MSDYTSPINAAKFPVSAPADETLLSVLRDRLSLTGTKIRLRRRRVRACTVLLDATQSSPARRSSPKPPPRRSPPSKVLEQHGQLTPVQQAFLDEGAFQCGYCTSGMIMRAHRAAQKITPAANRSPNRLQHERHVCRCGTYPRIVAAVQRGPRPGRKELPMNALLDPATSPRSTPQTRRGASNSTDQLPPTLRRRSARMPHSEFAPSDAPAQESGRGFGATTAQRSLRLDPHLRRQQDHRLHRQNRNVARTPALRSRNSCRRTHGPLTPSPWSMGDTDLTPYDMGTFGSQTTPQMGTRLRTMAAAARQTLVEMAAQKWTCDAAALIIADGKVTAPNANSPSPTASSPGRKARHHRLQLRASNPAKDWKDRRHARSQSQRRRLRTPASINIRPTSSFPE